MMTFETVHTMTDWYDGPRGGTANVSGRPHLYVSCWSDIDSDDDDIFLLCPISEETLQLAMEDWQIWRRWSRARKQGLVPLETHPCLPQERQRHLVLQQELKNRLILDECTMFAAKAVFKVEADPEDESPYMFAQWERVQYDPTKDQRVRFE